MCELASEASSMARSLINLRGERQPSRSFGWLQAVASVDGQLCLLAVNTTTLQHDYATLAQRRNRAGGSTCGDIFRVFTQTVNQFARYPFKRR